MTCSVSSAVRPLERHRELLRVGIDEALLAEEALPEVGEQEEDLGLVRQVVVEDVDLLPEVVGHDEPRRHEDEKAPAAAQGPVGVPQPPHDLRPRQVGREVLEEDEAWPLVGEDRVEGLHGVGRVGAALPTGHESVDAGPDRSTGRASRRTSGREPGSPSRRGPPPRTRRTGADIRRGAPVSGAPRREPVVRPCAEI